MSKPNLAASVRARLLNHARLTKQDFSLILTRYAIERMLYRISISPHADKFLLKATRNFEAILRARSAVLQGVSQGSGAC